jgi:hypothetical protein
MSHIKITNYKELHGVLMKKAMITTPLKVSPFYGICNRSTLYIGGHFKRCCQGRDCIPNPQTQLIFDVFEYCTYIYTQMHPKLCLSLRISDKNVLCISHGRMRNQHPAQPCFHLINLIIFGTEQNL